MRYKTGMQGVIIMMVMVLMTGCRAGPPWQSWMFEGPPPGREYTPLYVEGWKDGCETAAAAASNAWYKFNYNFKQDWKLAQDKVYHKGWKDAFDYCRKVILQYDRRQLF